MKAHLLLCDYAQVSDGKLTVVGAGWSYTGPEPSTMGLGVLVEVPWDEAGQPHAVTVRLIDSDGGPVLDPNDNPVRLDAEFEVPRPPEHPAGAPVNLSFAVNLNGLALPPGSRFEWELEIDGQRSDLWKASFSTRPAPDDGGGGINLV